MMNHEGVETPPLHRFLVRGIPEQQGSSRAFVVNGKPVITSTNKNLGTWRRLVADVAQQHNPVVHTQGVKVRLTFLMPKPKSAPKKQITMTKRPDLDKLIRSILDALTGVFFKDDSQVCHVDAMKCYAEGTDPVGVLVEIWAEPEPVRRSPKTEVVPTKEFF